MAFSPKSWLNSPSTTTPLSAAALQDIEARTTAIGFGGTTSQTGATYTAVAGDVVLANPASGNITVTLPSAAASTTVSVYAGAAISGTNQITVSRAGGATISGLGIAAVTTFLLGSPGASAVLASDGTNWSMVSGQQDTGWIALSTMSLNANLLGGTTPPPGAKVLGNQLWFRGSLQATGSVTGSSTIFTLPSNLRPSVDSTMSFNSIISGTVTPGLLSITHGTGAVAYVGANLVSSNSFTLDGLSCMFA